MILHVKAKRKTVRMSRSSKLLHALHTCRATVVKERERKKKPRAAGTKVMDIYRPEQRMQLGAVFRPLEIVLDRSSLHPALERAMKLELGDSLRSRVSSSL